MDYGENRRNQGKRRWEYPLGMKSGLMPELDQGFSPPGGLNTSKKRAKNKWDFLRSNRGVSSNGRRAGCWCARRGWGAQRRPDPSFSTPGGCWKLFRGSHWGSLGQSRPEEEKKKEKKGMKQHWCWLCPHFMLAVVVSLVHYNISLSVNVVLYLGSERVSWESELPDSA